MADEIFKTGDSSFSKYEGLLIRRDEARKEAFQYDQKYIRQFGDLILEVFEKKLECIRKKKTIEYCQIFINRGQAVDQAAVEMYLSGRKKSIKMNLVINIMQSGMLQNTQHSKQRHVRGIQFMNVLK